jgi:tetratricopeptide (TPR) repeat protein
MLPFVLLLYIWWKRGAITLTDMKPTAPFFLVALILGGVTIAMQAPTPLTELPAPRTPLEIFLTAGQVIYFYLGSFLAPFRLSVIYPRWSLAEPTLLQLALWPLLIVVLVLSFRQKNWGRHVLLGLGFFILTLAPVLGFVHFTFMKFGWVADHFAYLPMIGLVGLVVAGIEALSVRLPSGLRRPVLVILLAGLLYGELAPLSERVRTFADERTLWETTLAQNPQAVPAYNNLGLLAMNRRDYAEAITLFRQAVQLQPNYVEGLDNIAVCQSAQGDVAGAISTLNESKAINPNNALTFYELGTLDLRAGRFNDALSELQTAVRLNPRDINPHFNLGLALLNLGRPTDAAHEFEAVLSLSPGLPIAQRMLEKAEAMSAVAPTGT